MPFYVAPVASGTGDGSSWQNAAGIKSLQQITANANPGDTIYLRADAGAYNMAASINLFDGGSSDKPITIKGVDVHGNDMSATFTSDRAAVFTPTAKTGTEIFRLNDGADNLVFKNIDFKNVSSAFRTTADVQNITIENSDATNVERFFDTLASGSQKSASVVDLTIRDVNVTGFAKGVIRLQYDSHDILIENVNGDSKQIDGANFAIGVALENTTHDVVIRNTTMGNIKDTTNAYHNGDGFSAEAKVYNVLFENTYSYNNTDSGYDIKSQNTKMVNAVAEGNTRNFRIWSDVVLDNVSGINPKYHGGISTSSNLWVLGGADVIVKNSSFIDDDGRERTIDVEGDRTGSLTLVNSVFGGVLGAVRKPAGYDLEGALKFSLDATAGKTMAALKTARDGIKQVVDVILETKAPQATAPAATVPVVEAVLTEAQKTAAAMGLTPGTANMLGSDTVDNLVWSKGVTTMIAGGGEDVLDGRKASLTMIGGTGNDTYTVDDANDRVVESAGQGVDTVLTSLTRYTLGDNVENLTYTGSAAFTGTGNALDNVITGGNGVDTISAGAGDDTVYGGRAMDVLHGDTGNDRLIGGLALDKLYGDEGDDILIGDHIDVDATNGSHGDQLYGGTGNDTMYGDGITLSVAGARDNIEGGDGNDLIFGDADVMRAGSSGAGDWITGGAGNDIIYGDGRTMVAGVRGGNDRIEGGAGDDRIWGGGGADTFIYGKGGTGNDIIYDFSQTGAERDRIELDDLRLKFADLDIRYTNGNALIGLPNHDTITLMGVTSLTASDFNF